MSLSIRSTAFLRRSHVHHVRTFATSLLRLAGSDYGSGEGDPKGGKPQEQGANPSADKEHPGPPPPKVGQGTGGATKSGSEGHNTGSAAQQSKGFHTFAASDLYYAQRRGYATKSDKPKGDLKNAKPTLLHDNPPTGEDQPIEVKQHNKEMENRAEKATENISNEDAEKDKVKPSFWSGQEGGPEGQKKHT